MLRKLFKSGKDANRQRDRQGPARNAAPPAPRRVEPADAESSPGAALRALPPEAALARIAEMNDGDALLELAFEVRDELRRAVLAHPLLQSPDRLTALEKRSRNRDKSLNRHARRRLDRYRALLQEAEACRTRAEELGGAVARHDASAGDRAGHDRLITLNRRLLDALERHAAVRAALNDFGEHLPELAIARPDPAQLEPAPAASTEPEPPADDPFAPLVGGFEALDRDMVAGRPFDEITAARQSLTERWLTEADHRPPAPAQHHVFETVSHRFRELADARDRLDAAALPDLPDQPLVAPTEPGSDAAAYWRDVAARRELLRRLERAGARAGWPQWAPPSPAYAAVLEGAARLRDEVAAAERLQESQLAELQALIEQLTAAIDGGHLVEARPLLAQAHAAHDALPHGVDRRLAHRLHQQAARLAELKDWQTFATTPKREALVAAMSALVDAPLAPPDQAARIKTLRREWQGLGPVTQARDGRLADRFNALAEAAFEPCRAYFAEQAERRRANLAERERICEQLERYLDDTDWPHADMAAAEQIMRAARDEWRRFHPVERSAGKTVEARFEAAQARLHDKVKAEWDRNVHAREALAAEAERLLEAHDQPVAERIEQVKVLQRRWREVGITPHGANQRLWRRFRQACDGVFADRDQVRRRAEAQTEAQIAEGRRVLDELAAQLDGLTAEQASASELRQFRSRLDGLDRLPAPARRDLEARRRELVARYQRLLDDQARARRTARLDDIEREDERAAGPPADAAEVRRLTVLAELAAGLPSPTEDEALRLEIQVARLQAGLSGDRAAEDVDALIERWRALGALDAEAAPLRRRFFAALRAIG